MLALRFPLAARVPRAPRFPRGPRSPLAPRSLLALAVLLSALLPAALASAVPELPPAAPEPPSPLAPLPDPAPVAALLKAAEGDSHAWRRLGELCDLVGPRLNGSPGLERAVAWAAAKMREDGLAEVRTEPAWVPHWVRGEAQARLVAPVVADLPVLALGGSVGTPPPGVEADVLAVTDFDELERRAAEAAGKIVLFDPPWEGYGRTVQYRSRGADEAARHGAVACLIRSVTGNSLATLHTGVMRYHDRADSAWTGVPRIPAAALTVEDAGRLHRLAGAGHPVRVRLVLGAQTLPPAESANVVGEVRGRGAPEEIVVIGAHLDSWDVGTGAHDDGAGCVIVMEAARLLTRLPQPPRRTVRVVLYVDEESSQAGGKAYAAAHATEIPRHAAALECDSGGFPPAGFSVDGNAVQVARVAELARALAPVGAAEVKAGGSGADIAAIVALGVPGLGHRTDSGPYMDYHHSPADTFDKVDAGALARNAAAVAGIAWALAEDATPLRQLAPVTSEGAGQ